MAAPLVSHAEDVSRLEFRDFHALKFLGGILKLPE